MRAAVCKRYGGPEAVAVIEIPDPTPRANEVLIRVRASTLSAADNRVRAAQFPRGFALPARLAFGISRPRQPILGTDLSGTIEWVGSAVTRFRPGDDVIALSGARFGCHAEFKTMPETGAIARAPLSIALEDAAALPFGGSTALHVLRGPGQLRPGERLLVNGAAGAVGTAAIQIARHFGAHVTAVCSPANSNLVRELGASEVIDYTSEDFAETGEGFDVILDAVGNAPFTRCKKVLRKNGRLVLIAADLAQLLKAPFQSRFSGIAIAGGPSPERADDLQELSRLCDAGLLRPVIGQRFALSGIARAHALASGGQKAGSALIVMQET